MTKLHHTEYKKNYKKYILSTIEEEHGKTDKEKINYILDRFNKEYGFMIERVGQQKAMAEWLSGLALNIKFYYEDIVKLAIKMGSIDENPSEKLQARVKDNYWSFMANIILGFKKWHQQILYF